MRQYISFSDELNRQLEDYQWFSHRYCNGIDQQNAYLEMAAPCRLELDMTVCLLGTVVEGLGKSQIQHSQQD
jgi:hypothetical protein